MDTKNGTMTVRRASERGRGQFDWLDTYYSFSFAGYDDPRWRGFRDLLVLNEDWVDPAAGFPRHPHRDMEIVTYVLEGAVEHQDSMGNGGVVRSGDVQRMSAGTGILHSEANPSSSETLHLLQIWIQPERTGLEPSYEQKTFSLDDKRRKLRLLASPDGADGSVTIHQDARMYATVLEEGESVTAKLDAGRHAWIHVARGAATVAGEKLQAGDGAAVSDAAELSIEGDGFAEVLLFDLK